MRILFLKIFCICWIAQTLISIMSMVIILRGRSPDSQALFSSLLDSLQLEARDGATAYGQGGCEALKRYSASRSHTSALEDRSGNVLCGARLDSARSVQATQYGAGITGVQVSDRYVWRLPVRQDPNQDIVFLLSVPVRQEPPQWMSDVREFVFPQLPVAIAVGGVTTFLLVLLFTRPLVALRKGTREIAAGHLSTRIQGFSRRKTTQHPPKDAFQSLIADFNHMAERLESLVGAQKLLLRDVSHELRSPLARLSVALELAREGSPKELPAHFDRIERETSRLNILIGQLLTLSSMETFDQKRSFVPVSLNRLLDAMLDDANYEARERHCSVVLYAEDTCIIMGSHDLLQRAIENVVRNAIRYTDPETRVEINLRLISESERLVACIDVLDEGSGIPEADFQNVFRPFFQTEHARDSATGGFGVGLAIAERAILLHNGHVAARNRKRGGSIFSISFPAISAASLQG